ncbi:hypothetical protein R3W88_029842 [Solanum pinnatisectum]|uniref:Uncharacterized protein n=1 Tax=Solanum pinnatisectum TaxID=50273 RepID=A0AAV9K6Q1_9SOLN|nr:hypothetical protein R3W88_029842 [Solanum pinnatisectum]
MESLQHSLAETLAGYLGPSRSFGNVANYIGQMAMLMGKLGTLEDFIRHGWGVLEAWGLGRGRGFSKHGVVGVLEHWTSGEEDREGRGRGSSRHGASRARGPGG